MCMTMNLNARPLLALVAICSLVAVSCGSTAVATEAATESTAPPESTAPDDSSPQAVEPDPVVDDVVSCRGRALTISSLDTIEPLANRPEIVEAVSPFLESGEGDFWPQEGWQVITVSETEALVVLLQTEAQVVAQLEGVDGVEVDDNFGDGDTLTLSMQSAELRDGTWEWAGSSSGEDCELATPVPEGLGQVEWEIDPDAAPLTPESTSIDLLAAERACVDGQPMGDRFRSPTVRETETEVLITLTVTPPEGDEFTCPGNPSQPVTIELASPLGDREVLEGSTTTGRLSDFIGHAFELE